MCDTAKTQTREFQCIGEVLTLTWLPLPGQSLLSRREGLALLDTDPTQTHGSDLTHLEAYLSSGFAFHLQKIYIAMQKGLRDLVETNKIVILLDTPKREQIRYRCPTSAYRVILVLLKCLSKLIRSCRSMNTLRFSNRKYEF